MPLTNRDKIRAAICLLQGKKTIWEAAVGRTRRKANPPVETAQAYTTLGNAKVKKVKIPMCHY